MQYRNLKAKSCKYIILPRSPLCAQIRSQRTVRELRERSKIPALLQESSWRSRCSCNARCSKLVASRVPIRATPKLSRKVRCAHFETTSVDSRFIPARRTDSRHAHRRFAAAGHCGQPQPMFFLFRAQCSRLNTPVADFFTDGA